MDLKISEENKKLLEEYNNVLIHHVNSILNSRMLLDEDMHLLMTFWNPILFIPKPGLVNTFTLTSATCATLGILISSKFNSIYPLSVALLPASWQAYLKIKTYYHQRNYTKSFKRLIQLIGELYELNRSIIDYYHKRNFALSQAPNEILTLLSTNGSDFLKFVTLHLTTILEKIRNVMIEICKLVPITEGEQVYFLQWDFEEFGESEPNLAQFQKLTDLYTLIVSNFLSCIGLSMCIQLWKDERCNFNKVLTILLPETSEFLNASVNQIKMQFDLVRFTLCDVKHTKKHYPTTNKLHKQLQRPLEEFLTNLQITFETTKQLQSSLNVGQVENLNSIAEIVNDQFSLCDESFNSFLSSFYILTRQSVTKKAVPALPSSSTEDTTEMKVTADVHYNDSSGEVLEDEEYTLSVHGSDDDDDDEAAQPIYEYADQCSTEHLELMLHELKKRLIERRAKQGKPALINGLEVEPKDSPNSPPPPPPPPRNEFNNEIPPPPPPPLSIIQQLPQIEPNLLNQSVLDVIQSVALKLNRDEEVFGSSDTDSSELST